MTWPRPLAFLDTETNGLHLDRRPWEVGLVLRQADGGPWDDVEYLWQVTDVDMRQASDKALAVGRYRERVAFPDPGTQMVTERTLAHVLRDLLPEATVVGAVPSFDTGLLERLLDRHGFDAPWHHRVMCVEAMTVAHVRRPVMGLVGAAHAWGLRVGDRQVHTALGDARLVRDVWDRIMEGGEAQ